MQASYVKSLRRRLLTLAFVPTALLALVSFTHIPRALGESLDAPTGCQWDDRVQHGCEPLEGSWLYTVTLPGSPPYTFLGTETYAAGGGYSEADQLSFTPTYLATAGHGAWKRTGEDSYVLTYMNLTYANGIATGSSKVRQTMQLTHGGTEYVGSGDYFYYGPDYVSVVGSGSFTITAKKILVERPGE